MSFPNSQNQAAGAIPVWIAGPPAGGAATALNVTTPTVVKATPGTIVSVNVLVAGSAPGSVNDVATNAPTDANKVATIPNSLGLLTLNWPCAVGILIVPGTGQTVAVLYQ